jgi:hypothetical protein
MEPEAIKSRVTLGKAHFRGEVAADEGHGE